MREEVCAKYYGMQHQQGEPAAYSVPLIKRGRVVLEADLGVDKGH